MRWVCTALGVPLNTMSEEILVYYNHRIGRKSLEASAKGVELDAYKNPVGESFDLARVNAFHGCTVLIGDFSASYPYKRVTLKDRKSMNAFKDLLDRRHCEYKQRDSVFWVMSNHMRHLKEFPIKFDVGSDQVMRFLEREELLKNIEDRLKSKGFKIEYERDETAFCSSLDYVSVAWVISGTADDVLRLSSVNYDVPRAVNYMAKFVKACKEFHARGGGLLLFADNDPHYFHVNALLRELSENMQVHGNNPGGGGCRGRSCRLHC